VILPLLSLCYYGKETDKIKPVFHRNTGFINYVNKL
jgi:hypothetical protein